MSTQPVVCILGTGFMGGVHGRAWAEAAPGTEIIGYSPSGSPFRGEGNIADGNTIRIDNLAVTSCLDTAFNLPRGSIIDICLPTKHHKELALRAIEGGYHVMIEKPLVITEADAKEILEASQQHPEQRVMPAHCIRFWPAYEYLQDVTHNKTLGNLEMVKFIRKGATPGAEHFKNGAESGGGHRDLLTHDTDFADVLVGGLNNRKFFAHGVKGDSNAWDYVNIQVAAANNVGVTIEGGWQRPKDFPFEMSFEARFELGVLVFKDGVLKLYSNDVESKPVTIDLPGETGWQREIKHFHECVKDPELSLRVTVADAARSITFANTVEKFLEGRLESQLDAEMQW